MKPKRKAKPGAADADYVRDLKGTSAFKLIEQGSAKILEPADQPEPLRRFAQRERTTLHVKLPAAARRRLEALSRRTGVPVEQLARRWVEQGLAHEAG